MGRPNADVEFQKRMATCVTFSSKVRWRVPKKTFSRQNFAPRVVRGAHKGALNQLRTPNEGPKVPQVHPETLREHSWRRSGDQLGDLRNHEICSFLLRKCTVFQFLRFTASSAPGANNRHPQSDPTNPFWPPAPPPEVSPATRQPPPRAQSVRARSRNLTRLPSWGFFENQVTSTSHSTHSLLALDTF